MTKVILPESLHVVHRLSQSTIDHGQSGGGGGGGAYAPLAPSLGATPSQQEERGSGTLCIVDLFCTVSKCGTATVCEQRANTN